MPTPDEWFSQQLDSHVAGTMDRQKRFDLGTARDFKVPGWSPVRLWMRQGVIGHVKDRHDMHPYLLRGLPSHLARPIMLFRSLSTPDSFTLLLDAKQDGIHLLAAVHPATDIKLGRFLDVRSVYPKDTHAILLWIKQNELLWEDKEKSRLWRASAAPSN